MIKTYVQNSIFRLKPLIISFRGGDRDKLWGINGNDAIEKTKAFHIPVERKQIHFTPAVFGQILTLWATEKLFNLRHLSDMLQRFAGNFARHVISAPL